jgi:hypothetical protein
LNNNYQLKCEPVPTCDLCAQDSSGTETLANTMISAALMATYGLPDLCVEGTSSFTIPVSDPVAGKWSWTCSTPAGISSTCSALSQPTFSLPSFPPPNPQPSYVTHASCTPYTEADGVPASCVGCCGGGSSGCKSTWSTPINCPPGEIAVATSWTSCGVSSYECQAPPATLAGGSCSPHTVGDGSPSSCVGFCGGSGGCPSTWNCYDTNGNTTTCGPCPHGSTYVNGGTSFTCK